MKEGRITGILVLVLLLGPGMVAAQEGYKPVEVPSETEVGFDLDLSKLEAPVARVHARGFFRFTYLSGNDEVGHDQSPLYLSAPTFNRAFQPGVGGGVDLVYTIVPFFSVQYNITFQYYSGRKITSGLNPGDSLTFKDLWVFETSIGPRLNFPLDLPGRLWHVKKAVPHVRGLVPYIRLGFGYALSGEVDATFNSQEDQYYASTGSFHAVFAIGSEYHWKRWGAFVEMFAVDRFGPLDKVQPSAKNTVVVGFPFSFGATYRF